MRIISLTLCVLILAITVSAQQKLKTGDAAPDFMLTTIEGSQVSSSQLRGKVVLVTFWATYCPICQAELPKLNAVIDSFKGKDVVFLGVTTEKAAVVTPYLKKNPRSFAAIPDGFALMMQYGDKDASGKMDMGYPNYYLIDQKGKIAFRGSGFDKTAELEKQIGNLLTPVDKAAQKP